MKKNILSILFTICYFIGTAQTITASPGWNVSIPANTLTEAGSNYTTNATSAINQTLVSLSIAGGLFGTTYTVRVQKMDTDWHSNLSLWTLRTGDGTGNGVFGTGTITGGTTFTQLTNAPQVFYTGTTGFLGNSRTNVPIQYQIRGLSVLLPVKTYSTTVVYTISN